jgi:hypothetical protein
MANGGGVITIDKAIGDVFFVFEDGREAMPPVHKVEVKIKQEFGGLMLSDAIAEAERFAIGAFKNKMQQKIRGKGCFIVPKNIDIKYKVKYGFGKKPAPRPRIMP